MQFQTTLIDRFQGVALAEKHKVWYKHIVDIWLYRECDCRKIHDLECSRERDEIRKKDQAKLEAFYVEHPEYRMTDAEVAHLKINKETLITHEQVATS